MRNLYNKSDLNYCKPMARRKFTTFNIICLVSLWVILSGCVLAYSPINFMTIFTIIASGIIVFVPVYKSKKKEKDNH